MTKAKKRHIKKRAFIVREYLTVKEQEKRFSNMRKKALKEKKKKEKENAQLKMIEIKASLNRIPPVRFGGP